MLELYLASIGRRRRQRGRTGYGSMRWCPVDLDCGKVGRIDEKHRIIPDNGSQAIGVQTKMLFPNFLGIGGFAGHMGFLFAFDALDAVMRGDGIFRHLGDLFLDQGSRDQCGVCKSISDGRY